MKIIIDGDGCPVKNETLTLAEQNKTEVILVTTFDHYSTDLEKPFLKIVYVEKGPDAVDFEIVKLAQKGDLVITQDYGLASLLIGKQVRIITQNGFEISAQNIDRLLEQRYLGQKIRKAGGRTKGPKKFSQENRQKFSEKLAKTLNIK